VARQRPATQRSFSFAECFDAIVENVGQVVQGQTDAIRLALVCLVAEGHLLIEDVPGVGKTSLAKALARSLGCRWHRIQFTPDLLPSDLTGVTVYNRSTSRFEFRPGAVFANVILGDEINRASPKTQAALLEAMEERQVTVDSTTYPLPEPFIVIATQNPLEHEGTYPLPESQLDRFLMRIALGYPDRRDELAMLEAHSRAGVLEELEPVAGPEEVASMVEVARAVHVASSVKGYILDLAEATRTHPGLALGMSPRAALALLRAARAWAAADGRDYVVPDDVKAMAPPVLEHRLLVASDPLAPEVEAGEVLADLLERLPVPPGRLPTR
jgi:MoxR-like ATPase